MTEPRMTVKTWQLERYLLRELPEDEMRSIGRTVESDEALLGRLREIERSNAEILGDHPPAEVAAGLAARASRRRGRGWGPGFLPPLGLAAALVIAAVALPRGWFNRVAPGPPAEGETRVKGRDTQLFLYRKLSTAGAERLEPGSLVHHHDLLQIAYKTSRSRYGVIVSVDGRGTVTRHLPEAPGPAVALQAGSMIPLPQSYELDDAPAFERFYLVTSDRPFSSEEVVAAAQRGGREAESLPVASDLEQSSFALKREPR